MGKRHNLAHVSRMGMYKIRAKDTSQLKRTTLRNVDMSSTSQLTGFIA